MGLKRPTNESGRSSTGDSKLKGEAERGRPLSGRRRAFAHSEALAKQSRKGGTGADPLRGDTLDRRVSTGSTSGPGLDKLDRRYSSSASTASGTSSLL
ncbi:hypothetical protein GCM10009529_25630 [Micropruina glycogenica]